MPASMAGLLLTASAAAAALAWHLLPRTRDPEGLAMLALAADQSRAEGGTAPQVHAGFRTLVERYDMYIVDQWGVLHDGKRPYDGAVECLCQLRAQGCGVVMLSNSATRVTDAWKGLARLGFEASLFDGVVTSGELAWGWLVVRRRANPDRPLRVFLIGRGQQQDDEEYVTSAGCTIADPESADLVLARGTFCIWEDGDRPVGFETAEALMEAVPPYLERCVARGLPMLVSNPDSYRPGSGAPMPGLAHPY